MKKVLFFIIVCVALLAGNAVAQQPVYQTLQYDNNIFNTAIGGDSGLFIWAVKFDVPQIASYRTVDSVHLYGCVNGTAEYYVCQGIGTGFTNNTLLHRQTVNVTASTWNSYALPTPATLDASKPLWIVFRARHAPTVGVAAACTGNAANDSWYSEDSTSWKNIVNEGYSYIWMLRATVSAPGSAPSYTLTVTCDPTMGSVSGGGIYTAGDTATLRATANTGYTFLDWNDGNSANPRRVVVNSNMSFHANFAADDIPTYTISVSCDADQGSVTGGGVYHAGDTAVLTATPFSGYIFRNWSDGNADNPRTLIVSQNLSLRANFSGSGTGGIESTPNGRPTMTLTGRQLTVTMVGTAACSIVDLQGRVLTCSGTASGSLSHTFDQPGIYFLRISGQPTQKLLVR